VNARVALRTALGGLLILLGGAGLAVVVFASYGHGAACERMLFILGLPGSLALSGLAQCGLIVGCWIVWSAWRRARPS